VRDLFTSLTVDRAGKTAIATVKKHPFQKGEGLTGIKKLNIPCYSCIFNLLKKN
jgi:hypothetical protein